MRHFAKSSGKKRGPRAEICDRFFACYTVVGVGGISGQCFVYATMEFIAGLWAGLTHTFLESNVSPATKKLVCELIGTFVLVLTVILNVLQEKNEAAALSQPTNLKQQLEVVNV